MLVSLIVFHRPQPARLHRNAERAATCATAAASVMLVQQKHTSFICSAAAADWVQPRGARNPLCFINLKHQVREGLDTDGTKQSY